MNICFIFLPFLTATINHNREKIEKDRLINSYKLQLNQYQQEAKNIEDLLNNNKDHLYRSNIELANLLNHRKKLEQALIKAQENFTNPTLLKNKKNSKNEFEEVKFNIKSIENKIISKQKAIDRINIKINSLKLNKLAKKALINNIESEIKLKL